MTFAPRALLGLRDYWQEQGGAFLGIVGNASHAWGYHLGRNRIFGPGGRGNSDPSVRHPRDRAGLSNAAAAIDLGRLGGSLPALHDFGDWLAARCVAGAPGTADIAQVIWPRGDGVWYWTAAHPSRTHRLPPESTAARTHTRHAHISFRRDSERRAKVPLVAPYFAGASPATMEVPMYERRNTPGRFTIRANSRPRAWRAKADGSGWEVARTWTARTTDSSAAFDHQLVRLAGTMQPASLLGVSSGAWVGLYVSTADVVWSITALPAPPEPALEALRTQVAARTAERDAAQNRLAEIRAELRAHVESAQAMWARVKQ